MKLAPIWLALALAFAAVLFFCAYYAKLYLNGEKLPWWAKALIIATPFYFAAMYWAHVTYVR